MGTVKYDPGYAAVKAAQIDAQIERHKAQIKRLTDARRPYTAAAKPTKNTD